MNNGNDNKTLEEMKTQLTVLRNKLDKEEIVNDRMMRTIMRKKVRRIVHHTWAIYLIILLSIPYCSWCFITMMKMPVAFTVITVLFMVTALIYTRVMNKGVNANELMEGDLIEVKRKMMRSKRMQAAWLKFSVPFIILWLAWFAFENCHRPNAGIILVGGGIGAVIGTVIGVMNYKKRRRMITEVIRQIEKLTE